MIKIADLSGTLLLNEKEQYYLQYDAGMFTVVFRLLPITKDEAKAILQNPDLTDDIILKYQENGEYGVQVN